MVATRFGRIAVMVCYDLEFPEWVRLPALSGAQLLCAPVNWPAAPRPEGERQGAAGRGWANEKGRGPVSAPRPFAGGEPYSSSAALSSWRFNPV